jgi:hypothetical protein
MLTIPKVMALEQVYLNLPNKKSKIFKHLSKNLLRRIEAKGN